MRLWPRKLWLQTALMVLAVVVITQVLTLSLLGHFRMQIVRQQGIELARGYLIMAHSALQSMSPEELALRLNQQAQLLPVGQTQPAVRLVYQPSSQVQGIGDAPVGVTLLYQHLQQEWGGNNVKISAAPHSALLIRVQGDWWLQMLTITNSQRSIITDIVPWLNVGLLLLVGIITLFVRHLVRPLLVLEQEVVAFAQGKNPQPLTTSHGTIEVRRLADSIHQMMSDLRSHEQERRTMLAGLPHDIRAPLTRLRLRLALLDDTDILAFEQDIRAIEHIADQFIGYLRGLDAQSLKTEYFNLNELLGELVLVYQQTGQALQCVLVDEPIFVVADALMLRRGIDNLIQNALHHGAEPILVSLTANYLTIEDSGHGIPSHLRHQALEPFTQLAGERGNRGQVGLGLAVVKQILALHQLNMHLGDSELGGLKIDIQLNAILKPL